MTDDDKQTSIIKLIEKMSIPLTAHENSINNS